MAPSTWRPSPIDSFAPGGDSWNGFHARVSRVLHRLARDHAGQTVVAVCHAGVIMASMRLLLGIPDPATSAHLRPSNTGLTEWEHDPSADDGSSGRTTKQVHLLDVPHPERPEAHPWRWCACRTG